MPPIVITAMVRVVVVRITVIVVITITVMVIIVRIRIPVIIVVVIILVLMIISTRSGGRTNRDLVVTAEHGCGKTLAYLVPLLVRAAALRGSGCVVL